MGPRGLEVPGPGCREYGVQGLGVQGRGGGSGVHCPGCWGTGRRCRPRSARVGCRGSRGAGPCDAGVVGGGSWGTGVSRQGESGRARLGTQSGARAEQPLPVSLLLCSWAPAPAPARSGEHHSVGCPGPWGAGGKQVEFNGEWRVGRGKPCEAAGCHCSVSGSVGPCLWFTCAGLWSLPVEGPLAPGGRCTAQARAQERPRPNLDSVWGQVVSGHCHRAGAPWSPPFVGLLPPPRRKLKWK